ncbi:hypothetical protein GCM10007860_04030 [Chitiniphilus shinanonensis]|uniref:Transmembrane protein n=1 Tax=Chitiniphilus shinanonensis TaxID=553088 RepID=A0ABQ6BQ08_9NEIS|nr:DUF4845 domain-containing protein [Chitiniphilus shinanonensis]GLS03260.1 hypothetical protein GCM10007860_04030 [Chitiniphilus shinanonensis]
MRKQSGLSFVGFIMIAILVALAAITFFKVIPAYVEYFSVKSTLKTLVREHAAEPPSAIRESYMRHANISNIQSVQPQDLVIVQTGGRTTISASYEKVVPLVANVSLLFDFETQAVSGSSE